MKTGYVPQRGQVYSRNTVFFSASAKKSQTYQRDTTRLPNHRYYWHHPDPVIIRAIMLAVFYRY